MHVCNTFWSHSFLYSFWAQQAHPTLVSVSALGSLRFDEGHWFGFEDAGSARLWITHEWLHHGRQWFPLFWQPSTAIPSLGGGGVSMILSPSMTECLGAQPCTGNCSYFALMSAPAMSCPYDHVSCSFPLVVSSDSVSSPLPQGSLGLGGDNVYPV